MGAQTGCKGLESGSVSRLCLHGDAQGGCGLGISSEEVLILCYVWCQMRWVCKHVYGGCVYTSVSVRGMCVYVCVWLCICIFSNERAQSWTLADRAGNLLCNLGQYLNL